MTNIIKARRKLGELYRQGVEVRFGVGPNGAEWRIPEKKEGYFLNEHGARLPLGSLIEPDEIAIWVQAPSPLQREEALRVGQAARAKALLRAKRDESSEEHLTTMAFIAEMEDETLYDYVLLGQREERRQQAMREILAKDEWEDITALQDAMAGFEENPPAEGTPDWEDWQALLAKDAEFGTEVDKIEREMRDTAREVLRMKGRQAAEKEAIKKRSEIAGSQAFMYGYEQQMLFFSVRDIDHPAILFFENPAELASQTDEIQEAIQTALDPFISDGAEAKNLQRAASGSDLSAPPSKPETSDPSTPQASSE